MRIAQPLSACQYGWLIHCFFVAFLAVSRIDNAAATETNSKEKHQVIEITFAEINMNMTADMVFRSFLKTERVRALEGKRVRITGQMLGIDGKSAEFILLKNSKCPFGRGGQADHLINVVMKNGTKVKYREAPLSVEGIFTLNPTMGADGNTWSVFDLLDATAK